MPENNSAKIEAVLFVHGEPITLKKLGKLVGLGEEELNSALLLFKEELKNDSRGLMLVFSGEKVQLATKPELSPLLTEFLKEEMGEDLTPANLEVLSIVAYLGPISRAKIEYIRGVNSVFTLRNLLMRGLIERIPDPERGNAFAYKPSLEFLRHLGVYSPSDLEEYDKFQSLKNES